MFHFNYNVVDRKSTTLLRTIKYFVFCNHLEPFANWNCYSRIDKKFRAIVYST